MGLRFAMPVRLVGSTDVLANALPRTVDERVDIDDVSSVGESIHTARLYSDVSDDEFSDCNFDFTPEVNQLERDYFDAFTWRTWQIIIRMLKVLLLGGNLCRPLRESTSTNIMLRRTGPVRLSSKLTLSCLRLKFFTH